MVEDVVSEAATQGGRGRGHGRGGWRIQGRSTSCSRWPRSLPWEGEDMDVAVGGTSYKNGQCLVMNALYYHRSMFPFSHELCRLLLSPLRKTTSFNSKT